MKWQKLLWSFIIIYSLFFSIRWRFSLHFSEKGFSMPEFVIYVLVLFLLSFVNPIVIILRLRNFIRKAESFLYIFLASLNLSISMIGLYYLFGGHSFKLFGVYSYLIPLNGICSLLMFYDIFIKSMLTKQKIS